MKFKILVSETTARDLGRLEAWLLDKDPNAAVRVGPVLQAAIESLAEMPNRGRLVAHRIRAMNATLGGSIYVVRYQVRGTTVLVTRIFHGREKR